MYYSLHYITILMNRIFQILFLTIITIFGNVVFACAQNKINDTPQENLLGSILYGNVVVAYLLDAYGDEAEDITYLGYSVVDRNTGFSKDDYLHTLLLKGLSDNKVENDVVSFSSFMPDVVVVYEGNDQEVNVLLDFSHNILQLNSTGQVVFYSFSSNRKEFLDAVTRFFPDDLFLRQYACR